MMFSATSQPVPTQSSCPPQFDAADRRDRDVEQGLGFGQPLAPDLAVRLVDKTSLVTLSRIARTGRWVRMAMLSRPSISSAAWGTPLP